MSGPELKVLVRSARAEQLRARGPRALLIAALALTSLLGVREIVAPSEAAAPQAPRATSDHALEEFAQGFARAYLAYDSRRPGLRERALSAYAPDGLDSGAGLTPPERGVQSVAWTRVAQNQEALAGGRIVVVAAGLEDRRSLYLAVPVRRLGDGAVALSGYPSLIGPPQSAQAELVAREEIAEADVVEVAERVVRNYLAGSRQNLAADLSPAAAVSIPEQRLRVVSVDEVVWANGPGSGAVLATLTATDERRATWTLTYELGVERVSGRVLVSFIETLANET